MHNFMELRVFDTPKILGEHSGKIWRDTQRRHAERGLLFYVAAPLSRTPQPMYDWIVDHHYSFEGFDRMRFVFMDEMAEKDGTGFRYVPTDNPASFEGFCRKHFLDPLEERTQVPVTQQVLKPDLRNLTALDRQLEEHSGIDILYLALGTDGHYALVMPGTPLETGYHISALTPGIVTQHVTKGGPYEGAGFGGNAMSIGPRQVVGAKNVVVMIAGKEKKELARRLLSYEKVDPSFPLSIIHHPEVRGKTQVLLTADVID